MQLMKSSDYVFFSFKFEFKNREKTVQPGKNNWNFDLKEVSENQLDDYSIRENHRTRGRNRKCIDSIMS